MTGFLLLVPICIAVSRTCDYHHHWQDVLVGALLGTSLATVVYYQYYPPLCHQKCDSPLAASIVASQQKDVTDFALTEVETSY